MKIWRYFLSGCLSLLLLSVQAQKAAPSISLISGIQHPLGNIQDEQFSSLNKDVPSHFSFWQEIASLRGLAYEQPLTRSIGFRVSLRYAHPARMEVRTRYSASASNQWNGCGLSQLAYGTPPDAGLTYYGDLANNFFGESTPRIIQAEQAGMRLVDAEKYLINHSREKRNCIDHTELSFREEGDVHSWAFHIGPVFSARGNRWNFSLQPRLGMLRHKRSMSASMEYVGKVAFPLESPYVVDYTIPRPYGIEYTHTETEVRHQGIPAIEYTYAQWSLQYGLNGELALKWGRFTLGYWLGISQNRQVQDQYTFELPSYFDVEADAFVEEAKVRLERNRSNAVFSQGVRLSFALSKEGSSKKAGA